MPETERPLRVLAAIIKRLQAKATSLAPRDAATSAWFTLAALTIVSASAVATGAHPLWRLGSAVTVALICAVKGRILAREYLRSQDAGVAFDRLVKLFATLAPVLLVVTALVEAWRAVTI